MIQAPAGVEPLYLLQFLPGVAVGARPPRPDQSAAAAALLAHLQAMQPEAAGSSKSHARALAAAAIGPARIGIDVEYHEPRRDICAIGQFLTGAQEIGAVAAYRAATFREAYFKAIGDWPPQPLLREVAEGSVEQMEIVDGLSVLCGQPFPDFSLCLVWEGARAPRRVFIGDAR